jgi:hypothetical protein
MPACGRLFLWDSAAGNAGDEILAQDGAQRSWDKCEADHHEYVLFVFVFDCVCVCVWMCVVGAEVCRWFWGCTPTRTPRVRVTVFVLCACVPRWLVVCDWATTRASFSVVFGGCVCVSVSVCVLSSGVIVPPTSAFVFTRGELFVKFFLCDVSVADYAG